MNRSPSEDVISKSLTAAHTAVNTQHDRERSRLLQSLPDAAPLPNPVMLPSVGWRYAVGGVGLSLVASAAVLVIWLVSSTTPVEAMERMVKALDHVTSYTFRMESVYISRKGEGRKLQDVLAGRWRIEPVAMHATTHVVETPRTNTIPGAPKVLVDLEETHSAEEGRGIVIDHRRKEYFWTDGQITTGSTPGGSPQVMIYKVRERHGRVLRDLGTKKIDGREARGLEIMLDDRDPMSDLGPANPESEEGQAAGWDWRNLKVEVWVDPKTDLPMEFRCARRGDDFETTYRFSDMRWNVEFASDAFDAVAPEEYTELDQSPWAKNE